MDWLTESSVTHPFTDSVIGIDLSDSLTNQHLTHWGERDTDCECDCEEHDCESHGVRVTYVTS